MRGFWLDQYALLVDSNRRWISKYLFPVIGHLKPGTRNLYDNSLTKDIFSVLLLHHEKAGMSIVSLHV